MIDLKSELRKKLLLYFFSNVDQKLFLREIARTLSLDPGNLSKELSKLEKEGVFNVELRGGQSYFSLNKSYPLFDEVKQIIFKTIGVEGSLREALGSTQDLDFAFIHGSFAKGVEGLTSDIDLVLVGDFDSSEFVENVSKLEKNIGREINYHTYTRKEWDDYKKNNNSFVKNIIDSPKIMLKGDENDL